MRSPSPISPKSITPSLNAHEAARELRQSSLRHADLQRTDNTMRDRDNEKGQIDSGVGYDRWTASVNGNTTTGSYSYTAPSDHSPTDVVIFTENTMTKIQQLVGYDGHNYETVMHIDRQNLDNSWQMSYPRPIA